MFELLQRDNAPKYIQLSVFGLVGSITITRLFLEATGYPQLGNETLHIAHCLYGGVILYVASLIPLIYKSSRSLSLSAVLSGVGMGLFIDEVGKFMTQSNDYFFPPAAPIIYGFILLVILLYVVLARKGREDKIVEVNLWIPRKIVKIVLVSGLLLYGVGGCVRLGYYYSVDYTSFQSLLISRISGLPDPSSSGIQMAATQLWMEGLSGVLLLTSSVLIIMGKEQIGIRVGFFGLMIALIVVNMFNFYFDQFASIAKAGSQFILLYLLYQYQGVTTRDIK